MRERGRRGWRWRNRVNRNCDWLANLHCFVKGHRSNPAGSTNDGAAGAGSPGGDAASGNAPGLNNSVNIPAVPATQPTSIRRRERTPQAQRIRQAEPATTVELERREERAIGLA